MKKNNLIKWILIIIPVVLISNLIQYYVFHRNDASNRNHVEINTDSFQAIYENKDNIYWHYSSRTLSTYLFLLQLEYNTTSPNEGYMLSKGFLMGNSPEYYTYLEMIIRNMNDGEYSTELNNIIATNHNLHGMVNELNNYFDAHRDDTELPENWRRIKELLKKIGDKVSSGSSDSMTLYNITSFPDDFIIKPDYETAMSTLNEDISKVISILHQDGE